MNRGIVTFEREYGLWLAEQNRRLTELRKALQAHTSDTELKIPVDSCLNHYTNLFSIKANAAKVDACYLISGKWRTSTERFFQWIGGFRPTELLHVVMPYLQPLTGQQFREVQSLQLSCQCAEDALSQGIDKFKKVLAERVAVEITVVESTNYETQMAATMENLQALPSFVIQEESLMYLYGEQADHLRQETLQQMSKILTTRQAAWGLLALGEYLHRLRVHISSL